MHKAVKIILFILLIAIVTLGVVFVVTMRNNIFFFPGDRYISDNLDYMNVIYETRSDNYAFNEGYSETASCPWGFIHKGLDFFLLNNSKVIAASPGRVIEVMWRDNGEGVDNRFHIGIMIKYNRTIKLWYNFEPWTQSPEHKDQQLAMFLVKEGDWVDVGQEIARFLYVNESAHIHFDIMHNNEAVCPKPFFSTTGYNEMMAMIHSFHPTWELCYH
jgi:murein DD-endopeptidase MepM/ murein hydrolase activator NlpD